MTQQWLKASARACIALTATLGFYSVAQAEVVIGKTLDEIIELAKKEPPVQFATSWEGPIIEYAKNGFREKYGLEFEYLLHSGIDSRERILNEALGGVNQMDLVNMSTELEDKFIEAKLIVPVDWVGLFPSIDKALVRPGGHFLVTGWNQFILAYNTKLVSEADAPKDWQDCLEPKWKGKIGVYTRPLPFIQTYFNWGEEKSIAYHTALKAQEPVWTSSSNSSSALLASGEFPFLCGIHFHVIKNILHDDPGAPVKVVFPKVWPVQPGEKVGIMVDSNSPNASVLLAGWLATEGAPGYDLYGRSNPWVEGTEAWKNAKATGAVPYWSGWENSGDVQAEVSKKIVEAWGFPKGK